MKIKLLLAYTFEFLRDGYYVGLFLLLPFIAKDIHLTLFQAGTLQSVINLLLIFLAVPVVSLLIKFGEIKILLFSILLYAVGFGGIFLTNSFTTLFLFFVILGISFSLYATISSHIRVTWFDKATRGKELGNLMAVGDVAKVIFSAATALAAGLIGWRFVSLSIGIITILIFLCILLFIFRKAYIFKTSHKATNDIHPSYLYFLKQKFFFFALLTGSLDEGINAPFYAFLPFLLLYKGIPAIFVGFFAGFYYIGNVVSRLVFGRLVDKIGSAKVLIYLELIMAIITFIIALSSSVYIVGILSFTLGFITEGTDPATSSMAAEALEKVEHSQKASGIRIVFNGISRTFFPFLIGWVAYKFGVIGGFYAIALISLLPIIPAILFIKEKHKLT